LLLSQAITLSPGGRTFREPRPHRVPHDLTAETELKQKALRPSRSSGGRAAESRAAEAPSQLALRLRGAIDEQKRGRQRGRRGVAHFRPRSEWAQLDARQAQPKVAYDRVAAPTYATPKKFVLAANRERGVQCFGQGCRHQNPPARAQPKRGGGKQAKWSNPNPARSSAATAAKKARKNFKAVK